LSDLSDVVSAANTNRFALLANGTTGYVGRAIVEADISDLQSYLLAEINDLTASVTWANVPDVNITEGSVTQHESALTITESQISDLQHTVGVSGLGTWKYRTETGTPPASGQIRFDNANISAATEFFLHETNEGGIDVSTFLDLLLQDGSVLYIQDKSDGDNFVIIEISSSTDNGAFRTYGIASIQEQGTEPGQNDDVILLTTGAASAGGAEVNDLTASVTWANIPDVNVPESAVTQHEAAIDHDALLNFVAGEHFTQAAISITASQVSDFDTEVGNNAAVSANTSKVSNATHTGQVTGATALALGITAITAQPAAGALIGADSFIVNDGGTLSEITATQMAAFFGAGAGDVTKVGTPVNNQLGVWTGDGTLEGDTGLVWSGTILTVSGTIQVANSGGGAILNEQVSSTNPSLIVDRGDVDTGFGSGGTNNLAVIVGGQTYATYFATGAGDGSLSATFDLVTGKAASTTQTQGQATQNSGEYTEITTVANPNDVITLGGAATGRKTTIVNRGDNILQIFPGSGGDLGAGLNASITLAVDHSLTFLGITGGRFQVIALSDVSGVAEINDLTAAVTWANVPDGNITEGSVTQHVAAIDHDSLLNFAAGEHFLQSAISIPASQISDFDTEVSNNTSVSANTAKLTNATHTGQVTGSGALALGVTAITDQPAAGALIGADTFIVNDGGTLSEITATQMATFFSAGAGDVTKVGTPVDNQIGVWTGDGTLEGTTAFVQNANSIDTTLRYRTAFGSSGSPAHSFTGETNSGLFRQSSGVLMMSLLGTGTWVFRDTSFDANIANGARIPFEAATATNPVYSFLADTDTGIGWTSADILSLIAGGVSGLTIAESGGVITNTFRGNLVAAGGAGAGPMIKNEGPNSTNPVFVPNQADPDTGLSRDTVDGLSLIAGGLGCFRVREIGSARAIGFYTTTPIVQQTGVAVSAAGIHAALVALGVFTA
jgi:hypothetical protein